MDPASLLRSMHCNHIAYIGDGVYVGYDCYQIWLITEREEGLHRIALDGSTFLNFMEWARRTPVYPQPTVTE